MPRKMTFEKLRAKLLYDPELIEYETIIENGEPKLVSYGPSIDKIVEKLERELAEAEPRRRQKTDQKKD